jgi:Lrp/AsnC family transcriptional regulator
MAKIIDIDPIDRRILGIVQEDASLSIQQLAERVGLSANPCWRRLKRLEAEGVIRARVALVDQDAVDLPMSVFVFIRTNRHDVAWLDGFAAAVARIPEIVEAHRMSGDVDYLLKIIARDVAHYDRIYRKLITAAPGLSDVSSSFSMERLKATTRIDLTALV